MAAKPITIAGEYYGTRKAATEFLSELLHAGEVDDEITEPPNTNVLSELFYSRPLKISELNGREIIGWGREANNAGRCFAALLNDGTRLHFCYPRSLTALYLSKTKAV